MLGCLKAVLSASILAIAAPAMAQVDLQPAPTDAFSPVPVDADIPPMDGDAPESIPPEMTLFNQPVFSLEQVAETSVFGVVLDMDTEQVRTALLERGFTEPVSGVSPSVGFYCASQDLSDDCHQPGYRQSQTFTWTRGASMDRDGSEVFEEQILPFFYLNRDGVQRLYSLQYVKHFDEEVTLAQAADAYTGRFGEATIVKTSDEQINLNYLAQANVPNGMTPTPRDNRMPSQYALQRSVEATRTLCLERDVESPDMEPTTSCKRLSQGDERDQDIFEALTAAVRKPDQSNAFLGIWIEPFQTRIFLVGHYLPEAEIIRLARLEKQAALDAAVAAAKEAEAAKAVIIADDL